MLDEPPTLTMPDETEAADDSLNSDWADEPVELPSDLREAADDAEALLEAIGFAAFYLPAGLRVFRLPTDRIM